MVRWPNYTPCTPKGRQTRTHTHAHYTSSKHSLGCTPRRQHASTSLLNKYLRRQGGGGRRGTVTTYRGRQWQRWRKLGDGWRLTCQTGVLAVCCLVPAAAALRTEAAGGTAPSSYSQLSSSCMKLRRPLSMNWESGTLSVTSYCSLIIFFRNFIGKFIFFRGCWGLLVFSRIYCDIDERVIQRVALNFNILMYWIVFFFTSTREDAHRWTHVW